MAKTWTADGLEAECRNLLNNHGEAKVLEELARTFERIAADNEDKNYQGRITAAKLRTIALEEW